MHDEHHAHHGERSSHHTPQETVLQPRTQTANHWRIRHGNGTFGKWLIQLAKTDVLLLDDWGMAGIDSQTRADLLEIIDDRAATKGNRSLE